MLSLKDPFIVGFKKEIMRWNRQISLVSRKDTNAVIDNLLYQSSAGFEALWGYVNNYVDKPSENEPAISVDNPVGNPVDNPPGRFLYFDLGSGGGVPGVVWAYLLGLGFLPGRSYLVEPREKRAWFLERVMRGGLFSDSKNVDPFKVIKGRWGDRYSFNCDEIDNPVILISLKALHLNDVDIMRGLKNFFDNDTPIGRVFIARYYPGDQVIDDELLELLGPPLLGSSLPGFPGCVYEGCRILPVVPGGFLPASLVVSQYKF